MTEQIFKIGDPVTCDIHGDGKVVNFAYGEADSFIILVKFGFNHLAIPYTSDGRPNKDFHVTLHHRSTPPTPISEPFKDFRYAVGTDCWVVGRGSSGPILSRGHIVSRILEECDQNVKSYRVKLDDDHSLISAYEHEVFDVATRCNDALCRLSSLLKIKNK